MSTWRPVILLWQCQAPLTRASPLASHLPPKGRPGLDIIWFSLQLSWSTCSVCTWPLLGGGSFPRILGRLALGLGAANYTDVTCITTIVTQGWNHGALRGSVSSLATPIIISDLPSTILIHFLCGKGHLQLPCILCCCPLSATTTTLAKDSSASVSSAFCIP